ncbi:MAG: alkaline phosphatase D family protein, partial [Rhodospirillales bacterium]|nr:alkaline phosphatase D family protein [Rhodospirillales bacterium]
YPDWPQDEFHPDIAHYRFKHREVRADPHMQNFLAGQPTYAIWDDHEVQNGFDRTHPYIARGRQVFREYWPIVSAAEEILYRKFSWAKTADFIMLDCRSFRSPRSDEDGPIKTMLGATQKAWLKHMLAASKAPFKFILSSVPFAGPFGKDRGQGYAAEREEIRDFIKGEGIKGVIILSADVHLAIDIHRRTAFPNSLRAPSRRPPPVRCAFSPA